MISSFLLVPARVPWLVSLLFFPFSGRGLCSIMIFWFILVPGSVPALSPPVLSFLFSGIRPPMTSLLHMNVVETWFVAVWGLCWCNLFFNQSWNTLARCDMAWLQDAHLGNWSVWVVSSFAFRLFPRFVSQNPIECSDMQDFETMKLVDTLLGSIALHDP